MRLKPLVIISALSLLASLTIGSQIINRQTGLANPYPYPFTSSSPRSIINALEKEISFYQSKIRQNPEDGLERAALAKTYLKMARATGDTSWYLLAEQSARQSLANLPFDNHGAVLVMAHLAEAKHDFPETMRLAKQVLQSRRDSEEASSMLVSTYLAMGELDKALDSADSLVKQIPSLNAFTLRALVHVARGEDSQALENFKAALAAEEPGEGGSSAKTRTLLGRFYFSRGNHTLARQLYEEALRILPQLPFTLVNLAKLETRVGNYQAAERLYSQLALSPNSAHVFDHTALEGLAQIKVLQGDLAEAKTLWNKAESLFRQHQEIDSFGHRRELARLLLVRGNEKDLPEALALMQAEVKIRRDAQTLDTLAWVLSRLGRNREAQQVLQEAMAQGVRDAEIFHRAGVVEQALGNEAQADRYFQLSKETDPSFVQEFSNPPLAPPKRGNRSSEGRE